MAQQGSRQLLLKVIDVDEALRRARAEHQTLVIRYSADLYYASCLCGWHTPTDLYETVDLLRAMHAHQVTFASQT